IKKRVALCRSFYCGAMVEKLFNAIRQEETLKVEAILKEFPALVSKNDARGSTPLLLATYYGFYDISKIILKYPQNIDAQDASGNTALMGVCFKGFDKIAKLLLEK